MPLVKLYAGLRKKAGLKEISIRGATAGETLAELARQVGALESVLFENDRLRPHLVITLNGLHLNPETGLETPVSDADMLAIFPPMSGG